MPASKLDTSTSVEGVARLNRVFGTGSLVVFGLAYLVPMTLFTTYGVVSRITEGHLPTAYLITSIAMLFTALSYASLVAVMPSAGSAFIYAKRAFGVRIGFVTGWTLLMDYILIPAINYLVIGIYMNARFPAVPAGWWVLGAILFVTVLNVIGINVLRRTNLALVAVQFAFVAVFVGGAILYGEGKPSLEPFYSQGMHWAAVFSGAAILCLSFLGFDAVSTLSEEAVDPKRTVPRAILLTTLIGGAIFIVLSYAAFLVVPDWRSIKVADSAGLEIVQPLGYAVSLMFIVAYLVGCVASALASQAGVSRILYAMGRENVLPSGWFGHLSRFRTPARATLTVAAISLVALFASLDTLASLISFGALFAFSVVNLAVIRIFIIENRRRDLKGLVLYGLCPLIGFALTVWLWSSLSTLALVCGFGWLALGVAYSFWRPQMIAHIVPT